MVMNGDDDDDLIEIIDVKKGDEDKVEKKIKEKWCQYLEFKIIIIIIVTFIERWIQIL